MTLDEFQESLYEIYELNNYDGSPNVVISINGKKYTIDGNMEIQDGELVLESFEISA